MARSALRGLATIVISLVVGCNGPGGGSVGGPYDVVFDTGADATGDATSDTTTPDTDAADATQPDTPLPDAAPDTTPDVVPDVVPDSKPDVPTPSTLVDPNCIDGQYTEALPPYTADLSAVKAGYSAADYKQFVLDALGVRYPVGQWVLQGGLDSDGFGSQDCVDTFINNTGSANAVIGQMSTLVHECGHFYDIGLGFFEAHYAITPALTLSCQGGDAPQPGGSIQAGQTFARSRINDDQWSALNPPCEGFGGGSDCDFYGNTYLDGDPDDGTFDGGDQGFDSLMEESVQYVNSLATGLAFADHYTSATSERDGILTFLWYIERYLHMARTQYPGVYATISGDACWRQTILTVWGRAWLYLEATEGMPQLGLSDGFIQTLVEDEVLLGEIQRIRDAAGCN